MQTNIHENRQPRNAFRPKLTFYHPNAKGTGCAISMEVHPAHGEVDGSIFLSAANQLTVGDRTGDVPVFPRFDWENKLTVRLCFNDLCQLMQVFRGETESVNDGKGLYHSTSGFTTRISLRHLVEPVAGYSLELSRTPVKSGECEQRSRFFFSAAEAGGVADAISGSMAVISFGIPTVIERGDRKSSASAANGRGSDAAA